MQWLAQLCVRRPIFASVLMLVIVVLGISGFSKLGLDEFPNVDIPIVIVSTRLEGAAPEEVESDITDKIEGAVNTISGIDDLRSTSSEGVSQVVVAFEIEKDGDVAAQEVRDKINTVLGDLPRGIDAPVVTKVDPGAAPILLIAVRGNKPIRELTELADKTVRRQLESISGVGQVTIVGGRTRQMNIWLNPLDMRAAGVTSLDVQRAIVSQNLMTPGGKVETGPQNLTVRVQGRVVNPEALGRIIVKESNGGTVRVADVARVEDSEEEEESYAQLDTTQTLVLSVKKQSGKNTVAAVDAVLARMSQVQQGLPEGVKLEVVRDNSGVIRTGIDAVEEHLVVGAILAALVVLAFLANPRSAFIAALAIPISIVGTFGVMWVAGFTLNFLTLLALALAVGIVIDDAIVVLENIVRFIDEKGMKPFPAAVLATREIGLAVLATTLALMSVFIPVAFMGGIVGRFLKSFGLTMAFAIGVSLIVSFSLTPMLAARLLRPSSAASSFEKLLARGVDTFYRPVERAYLGILAFALKRRWVVVLACLGALVSLKPITAHLSGGFLPNDDKAQFEINVRAPEGTSLTSTRLLTERIANDTRRLPGVVHALITVGDNDQKAVNRSKIFVTLTDPKERDIDQFQLMDRVRKEIIAKLPPEMRVSVGEVSAFSAGQSNALVQFALTGNDMGELAKHAASITEKLRKVPGAVDVDDTLVVGKPELQVAIARDRAADLGVQVSDVSQAVQLFVGGLKISTYAEGGEEYDVRMRADARYRDDEGSLGLLTVASQSAGPIPLSSLVSTKQEAGPSEINRLNRRKQVTFMANPAPGVGASEIESALRKIVADEHLPPSFSLSPTGQSKETGKTANGFLIAFGLAFVFMYLILAAQFESWLHPVTILLSLPLTVPFALLSLLIFGQTLNLFSALGLLVLFGVVQKNAVLQIDHTNHLRAEGKGRLEAILEANRDRLRPILMTTLAFVAGMIPLITSRGIGSGQNKATAGIVLGGQALSLLLTLIAVPVAYSFFDDISMFVGRVFKSKNPVDRGESELGAILGVTDGHGAAPSPEAAE